MIRHACLCQSLPLPIPALPVAVIEQAFGALLIALVGPAFLLEAGQSPALATAIAMATIAMRADVEDRLTPARSPAQHRPIIKHRRHCSAGRARQRQPFYVRFEPVVGYT